MKNWLICYDIEDDKERTCIYKCLLKYGTPIQKSVFEVSFPDKKLQLQQEMIQRLKEIASDEANIRFYNITKQGLENSWAINNSAILDRPGVIVL
jgi:CRISPR-associated protein Cas2